MSRHHDIQANPPRIGSSHGRARTWRGRCLPLSRKAACLRSSSPVDPWAVLHEASAPAPAAYDAATVSITLLRIKGRPS